MLPISPCRRNEHCWLFFLNAPQHQEKIKSGKIIIKKSAQYYLISWKSRWGSEGVLLSCTCITQFTAVITPIPEWVTPKSPADSGKQHWPPHTESVLYQNFSITLLCTGIKLILLPASHKNLNASQIYGLPPSKACQSWTATQYSTLYSYFLHLKNQSNSFSNSSELAISKFPMELSTARCLSLQYGGCRTLENHWKWECKNASCM